jgi:GTP-binding protein EngB required for normal cell division
VTDDLERRRGAAAGDGAGPVTDDLERRRGSAARARAVAAGDDLERRLGALAEVVRLARGRLDDDAVDDAEAVVRRAGERLGHGLGATVVALAGPTGAGKSTLFNALAGQELARTGVRRPTTSATTAAFADGADPALLDWLDVRSRHALAPGAPDGLVLLDLPDFDSVETSHRLEVDRLVRLVDLLVWVADPQKYADAALHERYLRPLAGHAAAMLVVLNQVDLLGGGAAAARDDLRGLLHYEIPVLAVSARTGEGVEALREAIEERVRSRKAALARLAADVDATAGALRPVAAGRADRRVGRRDRDQLVASLATAAGIPAVVAAVDAAHRHRGALAAGLPWVAWLRRLRPDPLRRLGIGPAPQEEVRTSLPRATPVQRAQVDSAIRSLADATAGDLPEPWPALARRAATAHEAELADRLDRAVAGADLRMRPPAWWGLARWLQRALALVTAAGLVWLAALAALGYFQLGDVVPTPELQGIALPTALALGGLLAGLLLSLLARLANAVGARRRARRARSALHDRVATVAAELVVAPLESELDAHEALRRALETAGSSRRVAAGAPNHRDSRALPSPA